MLRKFNALVNKRFQTRSDRVDARPYCEVRVRQLLCVRCGDDLLFHETTAEGILMAQCLEPTRKRCQTKHKTETDSSRALFRTGSQMWRACNTR